MNQHPYLRAYMAGIALPTAFFLPVFMTGYILLRLVYHSSVPLERFIIFPMAVVPNLWGLWNILFIAWRGHVRLSLGLYGALLPILLGPLGAVASALLKFSVPGFVAHFFSILAPLGLIVYYLA